MAMEPERWNDLAIPRNRSGSRSRAKTKGHEEMYLCVALAVLLVWALFVGLGW